MLFPTIADQRFANASAMPWAVVITPGDDESGAVVIGIAPTRADAIATIQLQFSSRRGEENAA